MGPGLHSGFLRSGPVPAVPRTQDVPLEPSADPWFPCQNRRFHPGSSWCPCSLEAEGARGSGPGQWALGSQNVKQIGIVVNHLKYKSSHKNRRLTSPCAGRGSATLTFAPLSHLCLSKLTQERAPRRHSGCSPVALTEGSRPGLSGGPGPAPSPSERRWRRGGSEPGRGFAGRLLADGEQDTGAVGISTRRGSGPAGARTRETHSPPW